MSTRHPKVNVLSVLLLLIILGLATNAVPDAAFAAPSQPDARATTQPGVFAPFRFVHAGDPELGSPDLPGTARRLSVVVDRANALNTALVVFAGHRATVRLVDAVSDQGPGRHRPGLTECPEARLHWRRGSELNVQLPTLIAITTNRMRDDLAED
jgi:hypothetical protein